MPSSSRPTPPSSPVSPSPPVLIANPIYDVVFKYLMDDLPVARVILSTIIGREIEELAFKQRERSAQVASLGVTIFRLDFSAVITTADGERMNVLIEIQKADTVEDIGRFRRYLAENYYVPPPPKTHAKSQGLPEDQEGTALGGDGAAIGGEAPGEAPGEASGHAFRETPEEWPAAEPEDSQGASLDAALGANAPLLPILTIYILGFPLARLRGYSGICVRRDYYDAVSGVKIQARDAFIEHLTHDSYVIQVSELKQRRRNKLERLLAFFEQMHLKGNGHLKLFAEELDEDFQIILDRLSRAALDKAIRDEMDVEDEFLDLLKCKERTHAATLEAARKEREEARALAEEARAREEEERRQKEAALAELAELKRRMEQTGT